MNYKVIFSRLDIFKNVILDLCGNIALTCIAQLVIYPLLSHSLGVDKFGTLLTLIAISNLLGTVFGGTINNIRLIRNQEYRENSYEGDFRIIVEYGGILTAIGMLIGICFFRDQVDIGHWFILPLLSVLTMLRSYMNIEYRINLNYKKVMLHAFSTCIGYLIGIPIFLYTGEWSLIFLVGEVCAFVFASFTTRFFYEPRKKTILFKKTLEDTIQLILSNLMTNLLTYLDRLLINPVLGPANVSKYFIASMVGKTMGIALQPVAGVSLSYISNAKRKHAHIFYISTIVGALICGVIAFAISIPLSPVVIGFLYPNALSDASSYFIVANLSTILATVGALFQPVILRYCPLRWQVVTQFIFSVVYITLGYYLMIIYGLVGFCIGSIIAQLIRILMLICVGYYYIIVKPKICTTKL